MIRSLTLAATVVAGLGSLASAALFSEDFEIDQTANWTLNGGPSDEAADFFFDYSTVGIPAAPSGAGTRGVKIQANQSSGVFGGASASPNGLSLTNNYGKVAFDWWSNVNGPFPVGGSGSTQLSSFGVLTDGASVQWPGGAQSSAWFAATGDGNSSSDWRAYSSAAPTSYTAASGVYAAGTGTSPDARNQSHPYYASFGGVAAPAAQTLLFPQQTGTTLVGSAGMEWHQVVIEYDTASITWTVDGTLIATLPRGGLVTSGTNIFFGHTDTNATSSTDPNDVHLLFTLIDNVVVTIPEPTSLSALALGGVLLGRRRK